MQNRDSRLPMVVRHHERKVDRWWWSPYLSKQCLSGQAGSPSSPVHTD